jgi:Flp pilus assembly protein TadB
MKHIVLFVAISSIVIISTSDVHAVHPQQSQSTCEEAAISKENVIVSDFDTKKLTSQQKREAQKAQKQHERMERKKHRASNLLNKLFAKSAAGDSSGIGLAIAIILIGALLALLGLVGVADLLISIGIVVLVVGLVIWLITALK